MDKNEHNAVLCFYLRTAENHPSGTTCLLIKETCFVAIIHDVGWCDSSSGKIYIFMGGGSSGPQVNRKDDEHNEIDYDNDSDSSDK